MLKNEPLPMGTWGLKMQSIFPSWCSYRNNIAALMLRLLVIAGALLTFFALLFIIIYILVRGVPYLSTSLFEFEYTSDNVSMLPSIVTTIMMTVTALVMAVPLGIGSAVYLGEYAGRGNKAVEVIRITTETLAGIPSIIYGLFGMLFFVTWLGWGYSIMAGAATLAIMILPLVMRTTEEALKSVPDTYREASYGLGAGHIRTIFCVVLPAAVPGIMAGIILSIGRIVGETAALIYTAGSVAHMPGDLFDSGRTLAVHMYALSSEGFHINEACATAVVLLIVVLLLNIGSARLAALLSKK